MIRINRQQFWLYAAADLATNDLLQICLFSSTTTTLTEIFMRGNSNKNTISKPPSSSSMVRNISRLRFNDLNSPKARAILARSLSPRVVG